MKREDELKIKSNDNLEKGKIGRGGNSPGLSRLEREVDFNREAEGGRL